MKPCIVASRERKSKGIRKRNYLWVTCGGTTIPRLRVFSRRHVAGRLIATLDGLFSAPMASYTFFRVLRSLRAVLAPLCAIVGFSCLLTFIFILYQPTPGPGLIQRLGWQSWDSVSVSAIGSAGTESDTVSTEPVPEGVDWWNVTTTKGQSADTSSFPLDVWAPLLQHSTGRKYFDLCGF
jgi:hypothetical protein